MKDHGCRSALSEHRCTRRNVLRGMAAAATVGAVWPLSDFSRAAERKGRIKQSACYLCYAHYLEQHQMSLDPFAEVCASMGLKAIEQTTPEQWPILKKHGLICAMSGHYMELNRLENHDNCLAMLRKDIDDTAEAGFPNVITFSGSRRGMDDQEGLENSAIALKKIAGYAEQQKVTVCLELLNSIDHPDYMGDSTQWCVELVHRVGSPRVKILYDIYHAAMMKEDVLADIRNHGDCFGHYHTGGMPGRGEIDDTQTLDYPKIMQAILETGYSGYVGHEFNPKRPDALNSLERAVTICDV